MLLYIFALFKVLTYFLRNNGKYLLFETYDSRRIRSSISFKHVHLVLSITISTTLIQVIIINALTIASTQLDKHFHFPSFENRIE